MDAFEREEQGIEQALKMARSTTQNIIGSCGNLTEITEPQQGKHRNVHMMMNTIGGKQGNRLAKNREARPHKDVPTSHSSAQAPLLSFLRDFNGGVKMKIKDVYYRRLVSFRDEDGPHNEVLGATAEVDPEIESPEECGEKLIEWVEEELKVRMTLRESTVALRVRADMLRDQVDSLCDRHARMFSRVEEVLALHDKEIYGYGWDDDDLPF